MSSTRVTDVTWLLFRTAVGLLFTCHGLATVFGLLGGSRGTGEPVAAGVWPGWYAGLIQLVCGLLVIAGLGTRPAATLASGSMAYAYFVVHQPEGLTPIQNGGVAAALYAWSFLLIAVLGAGPWSIDALIRNQRASAPVTAAEEAKASV